jgi:hypothetical protein
LRLNLRLARLAAGGTADRVDEALFVAKSRARPGGASNWSEDRDVHRALQHAVAFLTGQQRHDGSLRGFLLLPGASTYWITAHAGFVLEGVPELTNFCHRAATNLAIAVRSGNGCGYNERVGEDLDSTAQALIVMHRFGQAVPEAAMSRLLDAQQRDGGFPTFAPPFRGARPANGWQTAHPDVTAIVVELLRRVGGFDETRARALRWLATQQQDGVLPSYWWPGDGYGVWVQGRAGLTTAGSAAKALALLGAGPNPPWTGMALDAALYGQLNPALRARTQANLLQTQCVDGSWACEPCLRVTDIRCFGAAAQAPGKVHRDRRRVFSTAHTIGALAHLLRTRDEIT